MVPRGRGTRTQTKKHTMHGCRSIVYTIKIHICFSCEGTNKYLSYYRDESRVSGKWVYMFKGVGSALLVLSHFSYISHENETIWSH